MYEFMLNQPSYLKFFHTIAHTEGLLKQTRVATPHHLTLTVIVKEHIASMPEPYLTWTSDRRVFSSAHC
jgi:hypothetical protein